MEIRGPLRPPFLIEPAIPQIPNLSIAGRDGLYRS
jgi:hypothetical protein